MANIFIRTIILYLLLVLFLRLSGKREVGQLELTELVTTFMISELASIPITNNNIPLLYGIIPAATLICLEVFLSFAGLKSAEGFIKNRLAKTINLRNTPEITFVMDQSIEYGVNMSRLIDEVNKDLSDKE